MKHHIVNGNKIAHHIANLFRASFHGFSNEILGYLRQKLKLAI
ncbi:hypothetical protein CEV34_4809 [Brucella pseudogrignonensis]|uniref:Uncharacterized protein n=1 Tax=Brucella pseudogrignonensis TaxID=419475 RepID=A0A256G3F4_9HYPH|nr:hypothetical protein CEV34_4809 [Brucella pseudogrignonensis]